MRNLREIRFRLGQEAANLRMLAFPPRLPEAAAPAPLAGLPDPGRVAALVRGSPYAREIERLAGCILEHEFPLMGSVVRTGAEIRWRCDHARNVDAGTPYFRRIPYLDPARAGDHKIVWELNRHQHLVTLAQAFRLSGRPGFLAEIERQVESWLRQNPWLRGMNWTSALEVAFRAISWVWVYHLAGDALPPPFRARLLEGLHRHGCYLERNLSVYFSPNTHLLGEAAALAVLGALFPAFPRAERWRSLGGALVREQMQKQVRADGSHFEQSTYYHVYALDFFLLCAAVSEADPAFLGGLAKMADYLNAVAGPSRRLPFFGDDDGGRVFHPYGGRDRFARATLASCGAVLGRPEWIGCQADLFEQAVWWFGDRAAACRAAGRPKFASRLFPDAGMAVMEGPALRLVVDAGPFGPWSGGHSHSDTLHFVASDGNEPLLIDPGTYTYVGEPEWRDRFRGSAAHNTVRIGERDQAVPAGPFRWRELPAPVVLAWHTSEARDYLDAVCKQGEFRHRRRILFLKPAVAIVLDEIEGPAGPHSVEQFWHCGEPARGIGPRCVRIGARGRLTLSSDCALSEGGLHGWRSPAPGVKLPAPLVRAASEGALPLRMAAMLELAGVGTGRVDFEGPRRLRFRADAAGGVVVFAEEGLPEYYPA